MNWTDSDRARFWQKVIVAGADDCWLWTAANNGEGGYGVFVLPCGTHTTASRASYILHFGDPGALDVDHKCRTRLCVNPKHLEAVTNQENAQRGLRGRMVTHCAHGHEFTEETTERRPDGRRACKVCRKKREQNRPPRGTEYWKRVNQKRRAKKDG